MTALAGAINTLSGVELERLLITIESAQEVYRRHQLFLWSQGSLQGFLPHEILAIGHGRYGTPDFQCEIVSRSAFDEDPEGRQRVLALVRKLAEQWHGSGRAPLHYPGDEARLAPLAAEIDALRIGPVFAHGVREFLGDTSGFFVFLRMGETPTRRHAYHAELLLPHLFVTLHRVLTTERATTDRRKRHVINLSPREIEIVAHIRDGRTNPEIAVELGLSPLTVKNHVQNILRKMEVKTRAQAVAKAVKSRVISHLGGH